MLNVNENILFNILHYTYYITDKTNKFLNSIEFIYYIISLRKCDFGQTFNNS